LFLATAALGALNLECLEVMLKINSFLTWLSEESVSAAIEAGQSKPKRQTFWSTIFASTFLFKETDEAGPDVLQGN